MPRSLSLSHIPPSASAILNARAILARLARMHGPSEVLAALPPFPVSEAQTERERARKEKSPEVRRHTRNSDDDDSVDISRIAKAAERIAACRDVWMILHLSDALGTSRTRSAKTKGKAGASASAKTQTRLAPSGDGHDDVQMDHEQQLSESAWKTLELLVGLWQSERVERSASKSASTSSSSDTNTFTHLSAQFPRSGSMPSTDVFRALELIFGAFSASFTSSTLAEYHAGSSVPSPTAHEDGTRSRKEEGAYRPGYEEQETACMLLSEVRRDISRFLESYFFVAATPSGTDAKSFSLLLVFEALLPRRGRDTGWGLARTRFGHCYAHVRDGRGGNDRWGAFRSLCSFCAVPCAGSLDECETDHAHAHAHRTMMTPHLFIRRYVTTIQNIGHAPYRSFSRLPPSCTPPLPILLPSLPPNPHPHPHPHPPPSSRHLPPPPPPLVLTPPRPRPNARTHKSNPPASRTSNPPN